MAIEAILLAALFAGPAAGDDADESTERARALTAAREVMAAAGKCTLVTLDASGHPQARVMDPFPPAEDFSVWMGTNRSTRKVGQIESDPRVTLSCFDPEGIAYVTLLGHAELVDDPDQRARWFKPEWQAFYRDAHRGDDFLLVHLVPARLEMISVAHGIASEPQGWKPLIIDFDEPD